MNNIRLVDCYRDLSYVAAEPVTLAKAKEWCYIDSTDEDSLITDIITQSRAAIEEFCNISICYKTITLTLQNSAQFDNPPPSWMSRWDYAFYGYSPAGQWFELPYGPVLGVSSVTSIDSQGNVTTLANYTDYQLRGREFKQIQVTDWSDQIIIVYTAQYTTVPPALILALKNEIVFRFKNRGSMVNRYAQQNVGASEGTKTLIFPFVRTWI